MFICHIIYNNTKVAIKTTVWYIIRTPIHEAIYPLKYYYYQNIISPVILLSIFFIRITRNVVSGLSLFDALLQ